MSETIEKTTPRHMIDTTQIARAFFTSKEMKKQSAVINTINRITKQTENLAFTEEYLKPEKNSAMPVIPEQSSEESLPIRKNTLSNTPKADRGDVKNRSRSAVRSISNINETVRVDITDVTDKPPKE